MTSEGIDGNHSALIISTAVNKIGIVGNAKQVKGNEKDIKFLMSSVLKAFDTEYIITAMNIGISVK